MFVWSFIIQEKAQNLSAGVPTAFFVLPNFHSCLYNLIETHYSVHVFNFLILTDALVLQPVECERSDPDNGTVTVTCNVGNPLLGKSSVSNFTVSCMI